MAEDINNEMGNLAKLANQSEEEEDEYEADVYSDTEEEDEDAALEREK